MHPSHLLAGIAILAGTLPSHALPGPWQENDASRVRLISPWDQAPRSGELVLGLEFRLEPGWHVYWKNSGDAGYPPSLDFGPTPSVESAEILWPTPERYDLRGGLVAFGYHDHVVYPVRLSWDVPEDDVVEITADLDYVVCEVDCIPYSYRLTLEQPLASGGREPVRGLGEAELVDGFLDRVPTPVEARPGVTSHGRLDLTRPEEPTLFVTFEGVEPGETPELFFEPHEVFEIDRPRVTEASGTRLGFRVPLSFRQVPDPLPEAVDMAWTVTGLAAPDDALEARRTVTARAEPGDAAGGSGEGPPVPPSPATALGWTLLGGLLLHWAPPLLAILVAQVYTWRALPADLVRRRAAATVLGIGVGSAAVVSLAAATGRTLFWGLQFQEPTFLALLTVAALLVSVNLWGLTDLPLTRHRGGGLVAGVAIALLALPWEIPFLGEAFEAAPTGAAVILLVSGWAFPYLVLALAPGLIARASSRSPDDAAAGTPRLRPALGFLAAGSLLWLTYLLSNRITSDGLAFFELGLLTLGLFLWGRGRLRHRLASATCGLAALLLSVWLLSLVGEHRLGL